MNTTKPPADRFVLVRNPYFHRVDANGRQLPYIDRVVLAVAERKLIPAKTGAGESDLQARDLHFNNYTFLKQGEKRNNYRTLLWRPGKGAHVALFPNLNVNDPVWRTAAARRALPPRAVARDRPRADQPGALLRPRDRGQQHGAAESPLFSEEYRDRWAQYDRKAGRAACSTRSGSSAARDGMRLLPDGRPMEIIVETAGEATEQTDVLELIRETWREVGIKLFTKPSQREVLRNRVFSGETLMSVWSGLENGLATPDISPDELAPTSQKQLPVAEVGPVLRDQRQGGRGARHRRGEGAAAAEHGVARERDAPGARARSGTSMLEIHAEQLFAIGIVTGVPQPVVVRNTLRNVPEKGIYNWDPGAFFGIYRPDTFWFK